jgi:hypothetical protein
LKVRGTYTGISVLVEEGAPILEVPELSSLPQGCRTDRCGFLQEDLDMDSRVYEVRLAVLERMTQTALEGKKLARVRFLMEQKQALQTQAGR